RSSTIHRGSSLIFPLKTLRACELRCASSGSGVPSLLQRCPYLGHSSSDGVWAGGAGLRILLFLASSLLLSSYSRGVVSDNFAGGGAGEPGRDAGEAVAEEPGRGVEGGGPIAGGVSSILVEHGDEIATGPPIAVPQVRDQIGRTSGG